MTLQTPTESSRFKVDSGLGRLQVGSEIVVFRGALSKDGRVS